MFSQRLCLPARQSFADSLVWMRVQDALKAFESYSATTKQSTFIPGAGEGTETQGQGVEEAKVESATWANESTALFRTQGTSDAASLLSPAVRALEWAGVGIDAEEAHRIDKAVVALASVEDVKSLRFWGRIQGTRGDYYIIEGQPKSYPEAPDSPEQETGPLGANRYTYWVASHVGGPELWTKLDAVTTEQLQIAPKLRRYLTGDLSAKVGGHPAFPGNEGQYLHAVICHISAATSVAPADYYTAGEGDDDAEFLSQENDIAVAEEINIDLDSLAEAGGWSHYVAGINADGGCQSTRVVFGFGSRLYFNSALLDCNKQVDARTMCQERLILKKRSSSHNRMKMHPRSLPRSGSLFVRVMLGIHVAL